MRKTVETVSAAQMFYYESQPGSWLVVICERSENRGSGGVVAKRDKNGGNSWCFSSGQSMVCRVMYQAAKQ